MKLTQLPVGARFEYDGQVFTKTGPMTAVSEAGGTRMIPRYAVLRPVGDLPPPPPPTPAHLVDADAVRAAFDLYHTVVLRHADDFGRPALEAARQRFLASLDAPAPPA
ncbi:hypothetical protein [Zoogloea sp.]|uniref:hypothetical protein n=1 Tax=Zoogloea sp. TaxID=49181 RepID=UPI0035B15DD3